MATICTPIPAPMCPTVTAPSRRYAAGTMARACSTILALSRGVEATLQRPGATVDEVADMFAQVYIHRWRLPRRAPHCALTAVSLARAGEPFQGFAQECAKRSKHGPKWRHRCLLH